MGITERIDAITLIDEDRRKPEIKAPKSVKIELTSRCNYKCGFCATSQGLRSKGDMDFDLYKKIVRELVSVGVEELGVFYLGESFLYPKLSAAIRYAKAVGIDYVFLTTNGSIATRDKVHDCMEAGLDSLKFSLNYADEQQFRSIARVKSSYYQKSIDNIIAAHETREANGYSCGLYASYIRYDGTQGARMQAVIDKVCPYVDEIYALPLYNQGAYVDVDGIGQAIPGNVGRADNPRESLPCWSGFTEGHITYDGHLVFCCFSHDDKFHMGDLKKTTFMQAWNSNFSQELRQAHLAKDVTGTVCERCVIYE